MRRKLLLPVFASICLSLAFALPASANERSSTLARLAISENTTEATPAIAELRAMGPAGLKIFF